MNAQTAEPTMPFEDLERAYETLAQAIDRAGPEHEALFLTRLALVLAHRMGRVDVFEHAVATALDDIRAATPDPSSV
jgi:hypothetical protein